MAVTASDPPRKPRREKRRLMISPMVGIVGSVAADVFFGFADSVRLMISFFWLEHLVHGCLHRFD
jgi:hypothetical protein